MSPDPVRLLEGDSLSPEERALLEAGRAYAPLPYDVTSGAARFRQEISTLSEAHPSSADGHPTVSTAAPIATKVTLKLLVVVILGLGAAAVFKRAARVEQRETVAPAASHAPGAHERAVPNDVTAEVPIRPRVNALALDATPAPLAERSRAAPRHGAVARTKRATATPPVRSELGLSVQHENDVAVSETTRPEHASSTPQATPPAPALDAAFAQRELRAVARARALLESYPQAALDVLDAVRRAQPTGYFVEERRALTVLALLRSGRRAIGREQGAAFLRAYPNGSFSEIVRRSLADL